MKLTIAISLIVHALVIALLGARVPTGAAIVGVAIFDRAATPRAQPPSSSSKPPLHALERAPRPRIRRAARALPTQQLVTPPAPEAPAPVDEIETSEASNEAPSPPPPALPAAGMPGPPALSRQPGWDASSCDRELVAPPSMHISDENVVRLEVELDAAGQVVQAQVVEHASPPLEDIALQAVRRKCRFTAGLDASGRPVPTIFELRLHIRRADPQTAAIGHFLLQ